MTPPQEIRQKLDQIKGHLVWMPLRFLEDAPMAETGECPCLPLLVVKLYHNMILMRIAGLQVNSWTESVYT